jgi:catecholate siderophore receptor
MRRLLRLSLILFLLPFIGPFAGRAAAQAGPDRQLHGTVLDTSRAPVIGARVVATPNGPGAKLTATTDARGEFTLPLGPSDFEIRISAPGFLTAVQKLPGAKGGSEAREYVLEVEGPRETVDVSATAGYQVPAISSATRIPTPLRDVPQSVTVVTSELIADQLMSSVGDVVRYLPGITAHQGENNRDQVIIRGNSSSADFYVNGVRDDVQYYRDLYNLDRVEALKGPNALMFGRGGGGGVINRVTKEALFQPLRQFTFQAGSFDNKRFTLDLDQPVTDTVALRLNGMYENSDSFRDDVDLERGGINPTVTFTPGKNTKLIFGYEYLKDTRVADRGITSFGGRPVDVDPATYFGNPSDSHVRAEVNLGTVALEHRAGRVTVRTRTMIGGYDRFYQNYVPGAVNSDRTLVALSAYNNATQRTNLFQQADLTYAKSTGPLEHTFLAGAEAGRQLTDNFRNTGFFNNTATSVQVPFAAATIATPVTYRQSATDADNHLITSVAAVFAQDQVAVTRQLQVLGGVRFDHFDLDYHNNRNGDSLARVDHLVSPRAGVVFKPVAPLSLYGSYSVSFLPSSGDQFSSLTTITQQVKPERFNNYEVGAKWDLRRLELTTAVYRLDRTNTRSADPNDPTRIVQTGSQQTDGFELGLNGEVLAGWNVAGGYAYQDAKVTSATVAAREGAEVGQVPHHTFSLWNNYRIHPRVSAAVGVIHRSVMFAAIDNTVILPGYTRADLAGFFVLRKGLRLQANVENLFGKRYFLNADSNTNITPGSPRTVRFALVTRF